MNHRQKLGYMVLGALILAIGITIGQFITPTPRSTAKRRFR